MNKWDWDFLGKILLTSENKLMKRFLTASDSDSLETRGNA